MRQDRGKQRKKLVRDYILLGITFAAVAIILLIFPDNKLDTVTSTSKNYFIEMIMILPAVMVLMGLFSVFISKELVVKYLGKTSGIGGIFLAVLFGALPTGPLYIAFPLAFALIKKGARVSNVVIFLSAWACIKIPQELVELQFLGLKFMTARLILTVIFVTIVGVSIEQLIEWSDKKTRKINTNKG